MKLLFIILSHSRVECALALGEALVNCSKTAQSYIHFDAKISEEEIAERSQRYIQRCEGLRLTQNRCRCEWGEFGLVQATFNTLSEAQLENNGFDYAVLLSESCLPTRPIQHLEKFLYENPYDYIEVFDSSWITGGLREERYKHFFPFNYPKQRQLFHAFNELQRRIGIHRKFPNDLEPRFGSQWWTLRWSTCEAIIKYWHENQNAIRYFERVWIPDELLFQTLVAKLVDANEIVRRSLTTSVFTNRGKPIVFYDDHEDVVLSSPSFFVRKVSGPSNIQMTLLERAGDTSIPYWPPRLDSRIERMYKDRREIQNQSVIGSVFFQSQYKDAGWNIVEATNRDILILYGPRKILRQCRAFDGFKDFTFIGNAFDRDHVDLQGMETWHGLSSHETLIRDYNPALYLARLSSRASLSPIITISMEESPKILEDLNAAKNVFFISFLPCLDPGFNRERNESLSLTPDNDDLEGSPTHPRYVTNLLEAKRMESEAASRMLWLLSLHAKDSHKRISVPLCYPSALEDRLFNFNQSCKNFVGPRKVLRLSRQLMNFVEIISNKNIQEAANPQP